MLSLCAEQECEGVGTMDNDKVMDIDERAWALPTLLCQSANEKWPDTVDGKKDGSGLIDEATEDRWEDHVESPKELINSGVLREEREPYVPSRKKGEDSFGPGRVFPEFQEQPLFFPPSDEPFKTNFKVVTSIFTIAFILFLIVNTFYRVVIKGKKRHVLTDEEIDRHEANIENEDAEIDAIMVKYEKEQKAIKKKKDAKWRKEMKEFNRGK